MCYNRLMSKTKPDHYNTPISPIEYIIANGLDFCEGNVVKYVSRWRDKGGVADLEKAIEYLQFLLDEEEWAEAEVFSYEQEQDDREAELNQYYNEVDYDEAGLETGSRDFSKLFDDWDEERGILGQDDTLPKPVSTTPAHDAHRDGLAERWRGYYSREDLIASEPISLEEAIAKRMETADPFTKSCFDDLLEIRRREAKRKEGEDSGC